MKRKTLKILAGTFAVTACIALTGGLATEKTAAAVETAYSADTLQLSMVEGASVRISESQEDAGIRFSMTLPKDEYDWLIASTEGETAEFSEVTFGMFVAPNAYHTRYGLNDEANVLGEKRCYGWLKEGETDWATSEDGSSGRKLAQIINLEGDMFEDTKLGKMRFNGAVVNMRVENFTKEYVGVGYIRYTTVGTVETPAETHYVFAAENDNVRSITYVAQCAVADTSETKPTDDQKTFLNNAYINVPSVQETPSNYYIDYYLRGADGTYVKDDALTQTVSSTVNAKVNVTYDMLNTVNGYIFNENFNTQLQEVTVYANNKTPHVRVNLENATIADFENTSDIWGVMNPNGATYAFETIAGVEEFSKMGKMLKLDTSRCGNQDYVSMPFAKWTKNQLLRAIAAGYSYLKLDVYYYNPEKSGTAWVTVCDTALSVAANKMTTLSLDLTKIPTSDGKGEIAFNITGQADYDIYVDNIRFGTDTVPTVEYLYDGFESLDDDSCWKYIGWYNQKVSTATDIVYSGAKSMKIIPPNNSNFVYLKNGIADVALDADYIKARSGKTLTFMIRYENASYPNEKIWINVGSTGIFKYSRQHTAGEWVKVSVSFDALADFSKIFITFNAPNSSNGAVYLDDFKIY